MQRSTGEQELLGRAEEMVKAHMAKCVLLLLRENIDGNMLIMQDMTLLTIGHMVRQAWLT